MRWIPIIAAIALPGCASTTLNKVQLSFYKVGVEQTSTIGAPFIVDQKGEVATVKQWVSLLNSPNGWLVRQQYSADYLRRELLYSSRSGSTSRSPIASFAVAWPPSPSTRTSNMIWRPRARSASRISRST